MDNMDLYNKFRSVPDEAKKKITGGRLNGMTDISPMWRIKLLTEQFGACGIGWKYEVTKQWLEPCSENQIAAFCNINLYVKNDGEWSAAIPGTGGSMFVTKESRGLRTSDECYKMALTDAISVACKALGVAADVYWEKDATKYSQYPEQQPMQEFRCNSCGKPFAAYKDKPASEMYRLSCLMNIDNVARCGECMKREGTQKETGK